MVKESKVVLNSSEKNQMILNSFFKQDDVKQLNSSGIWKIDICFEDTNLKEKISILTRKFLILPLEIPSEYQKDKWKNIITQLWEFNSFCINRYENIKIKNSFLTSHLLKNCQDDASFWSTYYPDPKSDIYESLHVNSKYRINPNRI